MVATFGNAALASPEALRLAFEFARHGGAACQHSEGIVSPVDGIRVIAPMPRLRNDSATWVAELRRLEDLGFDSVTLSHHVTHGWQLGPVAAMAFAAASTTTLRVLSLVLQNPLQHPALLAKEIATIDRLSDGRVGLGLGAGWLAEDYSTLGVDFAPAHTRLAQLDEALTVLHQYFSSETVDFDGDYYQINRMEALPRCVQRPGPPILVGAHGPRMLDLAGRRADVVGLRATMPSVRVDGSTFHDLAAASVLAKIERVRRAAAGVGRTAPRVQFSCLHVSVTDFDGAPPTSPWTKDVEARLDSLTDSPAVLVGTAAQCAQKIRDCSARFGIDYWHLGQDVDAAGRILARLR